jgi:hypothetical protein
MWLVQMPSLVSAADRELLSREVFGATRERMLREMSEALQTLDRRSAAGACASGTPPPPPESFFRKKHGRVDFAIPRST